MNQDFTNKELFKFLYRYEIINLGISKTELLSQLDIIYEKIKNNVFYFDLHKFNDLILTNNILHKAVLRKLYDNIKKIYKDEQANRKIIIAQIKVLLSENVPMYILKTDIENFYKNIDRNKILEKLRDDSLLSYYSLQLLDKLFNNPVIGEGLPMGVNVSAILSEIYMRKFDKWIRQYEGIYYYARFVDDIIIFSQDYQILNSLNKKINANLEKGLKKKKSKTKILNGNSIDEKNPLEYLGYKFFVSFEDSKKNKKTLNVSIANKKIKKIKTRIVLALLDFKKNNDFDILKARIKFLSGNYSIRQNKKGHNLKAGIYYNYSEINDYRVFDELNLFYRKIVMSNIFKNLFTNDQISELLSLSFKFGFKNKVYHSIKPSEMRRIKSIW